jgi:hypothetical protein
VDIQTTSTPQEHGITLQKLAIYSVCQEPGIKMQMARTVSSYGETSVTSVKREIHDSSLNLQEAISNSAQQILHL